jgi:predicted nucleic acid-binding protein
VTAVLAADFVLAVADRDDPGHAAAAEWVVLADEELVTTPLALADMDRVLAEHGGPEAAKALRKDFERGAYGIRWWADAMAETLAVARRRAELALSDASLVALAGRLRTDRIATFDDRFRSITTPAGQPFVMLPEDA